MILLLSPVESFLQDKRTSCFAVEQKNQDWKEAKIEYKDRR